MPHLAPLNWLLAPLMFWLLFTMFSSSSWWTSPPSLKSLSSRPLILINSWKWT